MIPISSTKCFSALRLTWARRGKTLSVMKPTKLTDTITRFGAALEKDAGRSLVVCSNSTLGYALYREHGLQVIPDESHEIDTGGACLLVVTPRADVMSGLLLRIKEASQSGVAKEAGTAFYVKVAELLKGKRQSRDPGWEISAMKDVVSLALEHFSKTNLRCNKPSAQRRVVDPITGEIRDILAGDDSNDFGGWGDERSMSQMEQARQSLQRSLRFYGNSQPQGEPMQVAAVVVCGVAGLIAGKRWLPLVSRTTRLTPGLVRKIVEKLVGLGHDPSYAQAVLQEMLARSTTGKRR